MSNATRRDDDERDWVSTFDHTDPDLAPVFHEVCARLRDAGVARSDRLGGFFVASRYDDVVQVERDPQRFSSEQGVTLPFFGHAVPSIPLEKDPPEHGAYRRFLLPWFTPRAAAVLEPAVRAITAAAIDSFAKAGRADLVAQLAAPIPPAVIATLLGLPIGDSRRFQDASNRMVRCSTVGDRVGLAAAVEELFGYLHEQIELRRVEVSDDLLGRIVNGTIEGRPLTHDEVLGMVHLLVIAGHETTVNGIAHMLHHLARDPALQEALRADTSLAGLVVEEALRIEAPVVAMARTVTSPCPLGDAQLARGDKVLLLFSAANRDRARFADGDAFVPSDSSDAHLSFGVGVHRCLGEHLARLEMRVVLEEVVGRLPGLRVDGDSALQYTSGQSRGIRALPVTFGHPASS
jgi:cytochrome P450